jgi:hypothetical protein
MAKPTFSTMAELHAALAGLVHMDLDHFLRNVRRIAIDFENDGRPPSVSVDMWAFGQEELLAVIAQLTATDVSVNVTLRPQH